MLKYWVMLLKILTLRHYRSPEEIIQKMNSPVSSYQMLTWVPSLHSQHIVIWMCTSCWKSIPSEAKFDCIFNFNYFLHHWIKIRRHIIDFQLFSLINVVSGLPSLCNLFFSCDSTLPYWLDSWNYVNYEPNAISGLYCVP